VRDSAGQPQHQTTSVGRHLVQGKNVRSLARLVHCSGKARSIFVGVVSAESQPVGPKALLRTR
jgi:hypothetical protein